MAKGFVHCHVIRPEKIQKIRKKSNVNSTPRFILFPASKVKSILNVFPVLWCLKLLRRTDSFHRKCKNGHRPRDLNPAEFFLAPKQFKSWSEKWSLMDQPTYLDNYRISAYPLVWILKLNTSYFSILSSLFN